MQIKIECQMTSALKLCHDVPKEAISVAAARALNKTVKSVQSVGVKTMASDLGVTQSLIKKALSIEKAHRARLTAILRVIHAQRLPLIDIDPRAKPTAQGVSYRGEGGQRILIPHAFVATMKSGHRGIFKRLGKSRLPICELQGVSIQHLFLKPRVQVAMEGQAKLRWPDDFVHELTFELKRRQYGR